MTIKTDAACLALLADNAVFSATDMRDCYESLASKVGESLRQFGAVGDGSTNDATAIQAAIDAIVATGGGRLYGEGLVYRVDSSLTLGANVTLQDITFDFSYAATGGFLFEAHGTESNETLLTSIAKTGETILAVTSSADYAADDYVWIEDSGLWNAVGHQQQVTKGEMARVRSIPGGTQIKLREPLTDTYAVNNSAKVYKLSFVDGIRLENIKAISDGTACQILGRFKNCRRLHVQNCEFFDFNDRFLSLRRCAHVTIVSNHIAKARKKSRSYGVELQNGCHWINVVGNFFEDMRHGVTVGGEHGVNRYIVVANNTCYGMFDAGIDTHVAAQYVVVQSNVISCSDEVTTGINDGIVIQGVDAIVKGNIIHGAQRNGILCQPAADVPLPSFLLIEGNAVHGDGYKSEHGILVETHADIVQLTIANNIIGPTTGWEKGILVDAEQGFVDQFGVNGNTIAQVRKGSGITLRPMPAIRVRFGTINSNSIRCALTTTAAHCIDLASRADGDIDGVAVVGNSTFGGFNGIRGVNLKRVVASGNVCQGYGDSAGISLDGTNVLVGADNVD